MTRALKNDERRCVAMGKVFAIALLLNACGGPPAVCREPHGLELVGPVPAVDPKEPGSDGFYCNSFERAIETILTVFVRVNPADERLVTVAKRLDGWTLQIEPSQGLSQLGKGDGNGFTDCGAHQVFIDNSPFLAGPLVHEMAHVAQDCEPRPPKDSKDPEHANWKTDGPNAAILMVEQIDAELYLDNPNCFANGRYVGPTDGGTCEAIP